MPLGEVERDRFDQFLPLTELRAGLERRFTLAASPHASGGPARYFDVAETGGRLGFITPLTHNFCESCNRVRVTCIGTLYLCLGREDAADLRAPLRRSEGDEALEAAIRAAILRKPKGHDFHRRARRQPRFDQPPHERDRRLKAGEALRAALYARREDGALTPVAERSESMANVQERIQKLISENPVVLFMKGTPRVRRSAGSPARWCRFSTISARPSSA